MPDPSDRLRKRVQLVPNMQGISEKAVQDPTSPEEDEALAGMAVLSNIPINNAQIGQFLQGLNQRVFGSLVQQASQ